MARKYSKCKSGWRKNPKTKRCRKVKRGSRRGSKRRGSKRRGSRRRRGSRKSRRGSRRGSRKSRRGSRRGSRKGSRRGHSKRKAGSPKLAVVKSAQLKSIIKSLKKISPTRKKFLGMF